MCINQQQIFEIIRWVGHSMVSLTDHTVYIDKYSQLPNGQVKFEFKINYVGSTDCLKLYWTCNFHIILYFELRTFRHQRRKSETSII